MTLKELSEYFEITEKHIKHNWAVFQNTKKEQGFNVIKLDGDNYQVSIIKPKGVSENTKQMTLSEIATWSGVSENYIKVRWKRFQEYRLRYGYQIERIGCGNKVFFFVTSIRDVDSTEYKEIPNFPSYDIDINGAVRNKTTGIIRKPYLNASGYYVIGLSNGKIQDTLLIHRLVMLLFNPTDNPETKIVDHINGIKTDNRLENLRWVTHEENIQFRTDNRKDIYEVLNGIIAKNGYEKTLELLRELK